MPEPTDGETNPFADIIDLFRETEAAREKPATGAGADAKAAAATATAPRNEDEPRGGTPVTRTPKHTVPAPSRRRRAVMLLPVALLALAGGATAAVIHQHASDTTSADPAQQVTPSPSAAPTAPTPPAGATAPDPTVLSYSQALDALAASQSTRDLAAAAKPLGTVIHRIRSSGGALAHAEAAHLSSLTRLVAVGAKGSAVAGFPSRARTATKTADQVVQAAAGRDDVPDPALATTNVVTVVGGKVVDRIDGRVVELSSAAGAAKLTAQLHAVATQARSLAPVATDSAGSLQGKAATRAAADAAALKALASLSVIDGDHLDAWAPLATPLEQALSAAGVAGAAHDVSAVDTMITAAQQTMQAWAAAQATGANGTAGGATAGKASNLEAKAAKAAAKATARAAKAAIAAYQTGASGLIDRYGSTLSALPVVGPGQQPSFALADRFNASVKAFGSLAKAVSGLHPPAGMSGAQQSLAALVAPGRAAAVAGQAVAVAAQDCDPAKRSCAFGTQKRWPAYASAMGSLRDAGAVRATLAKAASTARAAADSAAKAAATSTKPAAGTSATDAAPPKPIV